jgi:hypothetical protein
MYFPYLRGKQYELIALRELSSVMANKRAKVSPIIEPVKDSSTLKKTLSDLRAQNINFNIIINPKKGDLIASTAAILGVLNGELNDYNDYQLAVILDGNENHQYIIDQVQQSGISVNGFSLIHNSVSDTIATISSRYSELSPVVNNVINFSKTNRRYHRNFNANTVVGLDDFFQSQDKNSAYANIDDSQFSEEHLFYAQDGFKGFSDFLTIGDNYTESGMLPFAVAIHLSYAAANNSIRVKHFVSDSNDDRADTAGKFAEALEKLVQWCNDNNLNSLAINEFKEFHHSGHFPGLGSIKKLSIMQHIELVLTLI